MPTNICESSRDSQRLPVDDFSSKSRNQSAKTGSSSWSAITKIVRETWVLSNHFGSIPSTLTSLEKFPHVVFPLSELDGLEMKVCDEDRHYQRSTRPASSNHHGLIESNAKRVELYDYQFQSGQNLRLLGLSIFHKLICR